MARTAEQRAKHAAYMREWRAKKKAERETAERPKQDEQPRRDAEREARKAEQRARHREAQRQYRARKKANEAVAKAKTDAEKVEAWKAFGLNDRERGLMLLADHQGLDFINLKNIKSFAAYVAMREAQRGQSFKYEELIEVAKEYNRAVEQGIDPLKLQEDFEAYQQMELESLEQTKGEMSKAEYKKYSMEAIDNAWARLVDDAIDEKRYGK